MFALLFVMAHLASSPPADAPQPVASAFGAPVGDADLDSLRGGIGVSDLDLHQINQIGQKAEMSDNVIFSSVNGGNQMTTGAFAGANGIATVIQNSGNQVIIQNAMILNLNLQ